jgi:hypothetical protein
MGNVTGIRGNGMMATRVDVNQNLAANDGSPRLDDPQNKVDPIVKTKKGLI